MRHKPLGCNLLSQMIVLLDRFVTGDRDAARTFPMIHAANRCASYKNEPDYMKGKLILLFQILCYTLTYSQGMTVPVMINQEPKPGLRVKVVPENFKGTDIYYSLYLPENYKQGKKYPVIVEYTGNKWPPTGSTGEVKDANLGYAVAKKFKQFGLFFRILRIISQLLHGGAVKKKLLILH